MADLNDTITGLLESPLFNIGVGLLAAGGPSPQPVGVGQGLLQAVGFAQERQQGLLRNEIVREQLRERAQQRQAAQQLSEVAGGLLGVSNPQQGEMLGLLAQAAPEAFTSGVLGQVFRQPRAEPADLRMMDALGIARTPEGFAEFNRLKGDDGDALLRQVQARQASLQTQIAEENLRTKRREREQAEKSAAQDRRDGQIATRVGLQNMVELVGLVDRLEGSFLEPGGGGDELRRLGLGAVALVGNTLGFDTETQTRLAADYDRFQGLATGAALQNLDVLRGTGAISDTKFQTLLNTFTNPKASPDAIRKALADGIEAQLGAAPRFDVDLQEEERLEFGALVERLRRGGVARQPAASLGQRAVSPASGGAVIDFGDLPGGS